MEQECAPSFWWRSKIALCSLPNSMGHFIHHVIGTHFSPESVWGWSCWLKHWKFWLWSCQAGCLYFEKKQFFLIALCYLAFYLVLHCSLMFWILMYCAAPQELLTGGTPLKNEFIISTRANKSATRLGNLIPSILMAHKKAISHCMLIPKSASVHQRAEISFLNWAHSQGSCYNAGNSKGQVFIFPFIL